MKKIVKLLLLFVMPLLFVACIEGRENTFRGKLTLQDTWSDGMMVVMYYYTFDIYDIK